MFIVDSQVHIWGEDTPERPWSEDNPAKPHKAHFGKDVLLQEMADAGVSRCVLIPPSWEGNRNDLALEAARQRPDRFAVAGRFPLDDPNRRELMRNWIRPGMLGIRLTLRSEREKRLLFDPGEDWLWAAAEDAGVPIMAYPNGQTAGIDAIAERHPDLRLVIDHLGLVRAKDAAATVDLPALVKMARHPNVAVKASSLPFYTTEPYPFRNLHEPLRRILDAFGPSRVFWGSDLTRLPCSYRQCVTMFTEEMPWLAEEDKASVMGRALCSWLNWPTPSEGSYQIKTATAEPD